MKTTKKTTLRVLAMLLGVCMTLGCMLPALAQENLEELELDSPLPDAIAVSAAVDTLPARSAILITQNDGQILYEKDPDMVLPPASITKVMTMLLVVEAVEKGDITLNDTVTASVYACSMGGSQIWLEPGEEMTVHELFKAVAVSSANDAATALGEHLAGSDDAFVARMNQRAAELGMVNTHFVNANGLDADGHVSTARDIALMSRELMQYPLVGEYTTIWMDSLRDGATELTNTNKLVRFYPGATGLKTGTTNGAGSCLSATATRDNLGLIAVVMGSETSNDRFASARSLLDYGFGNYVVAEIPDIQNQLLPVPVLRGTNSQVAVICEPPSNLVVKRGQEKSIQQLITLISDVEAPVEAGQTLGKVEIQIDGKLVEEYPIRAAIDVDKMHFGSAFTRMLGGVLNIKAPPRAPMQQDIPPSSAAAPEDAGSSSSAAPQ